MAAEKKERQITPFGEARYPHLSKPRKYKNPQSGKEQGEPKYSLQVVFGEKDTEWTKWATDLTAKVRALPVTLSGGPGSPALPKKSPIKRLLDDEQKPTDKFVVSFSTGGQYRPDVVDKYGREIPEGIEVGSGSTVRVGYVENAYQNDSKVWGISLYLNGVQVRDLVEYKGDAAGRHGFSTESLPDGEPKEIKAPEPAPAAAGSNTPPPAPEDDLPF